MVLKFWEPHDPFMLLEIIENIEELDIYDLRNWQLKKKTMLIYLEIAIINSGVSILLCKGPDSEYFWIYEP